MILLVHSCDSRKWLWPHWWKFFNLSGWDVTPQFITGETFTDQLIKTLEGIKDEYIWYTLDDYFIQFPIDFEYYWNLAHRIKADALRVQPNVNILKSFPYIFEWAGDLFKQLERSPYTISTHTSVWRREYFLDCLTPGLNPWQFERSTPENFGDVYFVPKLPYWYIDGVLSGVITNEAKALIK